MLIDWNDIDTVLLDMDGTLLDLQFDNFFWHTHLPKRYAELRNISLQKAKNIISTMSRKMKGTLNWYSTEYWSKELTLDIYQLKKELSDQIRIRPFAQEFLGQLKLRGKKRILITNAHPQSLELKISITKIDTLLDSIYTSHQFHHPKESQKFWQALSCKEIFNPKKTLFIDDSIGILEAANQYGIKHLLGISQPDSKKNAVSLDSFSSITSFDEILPVV